MILPHKRKQREEQQGSASSREHRAACTSPTTAPSSSPPLFARNGVALTSNARARRFRRWCRPYAQPRLQPLVRCCTRRGLQQRNAPQCARRLGAAATSAPHLTSRAIPLALRRVRERSMHATYAQPQAVPGVSPPVWAPPPVAHQVRACTRVGALAGVFLGQCDTRVAAPACVLRRPRRFR